MSTVTKPGNKVMNALCINYPTRVCASVSPNSVGLSACKVKPGNDNRWKSRQKQPLWFLPGTQTIGLSHFDCFDVVYEVLTPLSDHFERYFNSRRTDKQTEAIA